MVINVTVCNIHLKIINDLEIVKLKVNPSNKDTPLIGTLFPSPMTVRIRGSFTVIVQADCKFYLGIITAYHLKTVFFI